MKAKRGLWLLSADRFVPGVFPPARTATASWGHARQLAAERLLARARWSRRGTREKAEAHIARAKQLSLSLLYWLQTECPPARRRGRLEGAPAPTRPGRGLERRPGKGASTSANRGGSKGRGHGRRAARRHRARRKQLGTDDVTAEAVLGQARAWGVTGSTSTRDPGAATPTSTSAPARFRSPLGALLPLRVENLLARLQEPRRHAHHQRLRHPPAPRRMGNRRGRRPSGRLLRRRTHHPGRRPRRPGRVPTGTGGGRRRAALAA